MAAIDFASHTPAGLQQFTPPAGLILANGVHLADATIGYQTWGKLNAAGDNVVWICHALTGTTDAMVWWSEIFGSNRAIDPEQDFVVCANVLGGCYGSAGPTTNPDFPAITISDMVRQQYLLAQHLKIKSIRLMLGGSMGGFQALEWSIRYPHMVQRLALVATSYRQPAQAIALSSLQCAQIRNDPKFNGGRYDPNDPPVEGLALARQIGHLSYRCFDELDARFDRQQDASGNFQVNNYLAHQGRKLTKRFDANSYLILNAAMNAFDACEGRGEPRFALGRLQLPVLIVSVDTDWLYPPSEQARLANLLPNAALVHIHSRAGHDGFLLDAAQFEPALRSFARDADTVLARATYR
jgi:homoserine O-acetyltransferase/O-succinyltransferase